MEAPQFHSPGDGRKTLTISLRRASEKHGPISHYLVVVVPGEPVHNPEYYKIGKHDTF
jgi:hypothetical protein